MFEVMRGNVCECFLRVCEVAELGGCHYVSTLTPLKCTEAGWSGVICSDDAADSKAIKTAVEPTLRIKNKDLDGSISDHYVGHVWCYSI